MKRPEPGPTLFHHRRALLTACALIALIGAQPGAAEPLRLTLRDRVPAAGDPERFTVRERPETWAPHQTAVIICDMWDLHHCKRAVDRVQELAPRMNELVARARDRGVLIIHAPSSCMAPYENTPMRRRAKEAPAAANLPKDIGSWCHKIPAEEKGKYPIDQTDGGEDDEAEEHAKWAAHLSSLGRNPKAPWKSQYDVLKMDERDAVSDSGVEIWNLLEARGISNVILMGVHTNMCVLGRPFGLRQMARNGKHVVLMRDLTDTMYNPARWPHVSHFRGTELILEHVEKFVCPTVTSDQILGGKPFRFKGDTEGAGIFAPGAQLKVEAEGGAGGEGPAFDPQLGVLTSGNSHVYRLDRQGKSTIHRKDAGTNGLLFDFQGRLLACEPAQRRVTRTEKDGSITVLAERYKGQRFNQPNDLTLDSKGRLYFSDPRYGNDAGKDIRDEKGRIVEGVYRVDPDGAVRLILGPDAVERPNGVLVSADDRYLYVADNNNNHVGGARKLWRFDLKADGTVDAASRKLLYDWGAGRGPDGVKQDREGRLYVAGGLNKPNPPFEPAEDKKGGIYVLSPEGQLLEFLPVPRDEVTNCAFGGDDLQTLYVTGGGTLYSIRTATPGRVTWPRVGLGQGPLPEALQKFLTCADELTILSLKPFSCVIGGDSDWGGKVRFHEEGVVGKAVVKNASERTRLLDAFFKGLSLGDQSVIVFKPYHGIRAKKGVSIVDVVISFPSGLVRVFTEGTSEPLELPISNAYHFGRAFDVLFSRHGIPLAD